MKSKKDKKIENQVNLVTRPPIVVVLGHVDHGKTTLLDYIRKTSVAAKESGGITQHIGAYQIEYQEKKVTFIDTPGHEAFSQMRSRGARVADIAILIIAAEEGIKPQTKEVISHIKEYKIPVVVALNKIDKPGANAAKVAGELAKEGILVESQGGDVPSVNISAKNGQGVDELLEVLLLVAEMEELKADFNKKASGVVIESFLDSQRGPTATLLIRNGTLMRGDIIVCGDSCGKAKILEDFQGNSIEKALSSMPAVMLGLNEVPVVGEVFNVVESEEVARKSADEYKQRAIKKQKDKDIENIKKKEEVEKSAEESSENALGDSKEPDDLGGEQEEAEPKQLNIILKADVRGSMEAIKGTLDNIQQDQAQINIIKSEVGDISESDVKLAYSSNAIIVGFRVKSPNLIFNLAKRQGVKIKVFEVIYEVVEEIKKQLTGLLEPEIIKEELGTLKIIAIFKKEKSRMIVGGKVTSGVIKNRVLADVIRDKKKIATGRITQLQHNKKDAGEVEKGKEAGILFEGNPIIEEGDIIVAYREEKKKQEL